MAVDKFNDLHEVGLTASGYMIYKKWNRLIGGWDYISDSCSVGHVIVDSIVDMAELEVVMRDKQNPDKSLDPTNEELEEWREQQRKARRDES